MWISVIPILLHSITLSILSPLYLSIHTYFYLLLLLLHILNYLIEHPSPRGRTDPLTRMDPAVEWISYGTIR